MKTSTPGSLNSTYVGMSRTMNWFDFSIVALFATHFAPPSFAGLTSRGATYRFHFQDAPSVKAL